MPVGLAQHDAMLSHNVNLRQIRAFVTVADKKSFVRAAVALNMSQSALSQCIRQLEDYVGSPLFTRTTRNVALTPLANSFLPSLRDLLDNFDKLMGDMSEAVSRKHGHVAIACLPSVASRLMPRVLAANERRFPGVRVTIMDANMKGVASLLLSNTVELAIGSAITGFPDLRSVAFARDQLHAVLPVSHPLARKRRIAWDEIASQPFIAMSRETGMRDLIDDVVRARNIPLNIVGEVSNLSTMGAMVEEGLGMAVLPSLSLPHPNHPFIRSRPLYSPQISRTIRLFWRREGGLSPAAAAIVSSLQETIAQQKLGPAFEGIVWDANALRDVTVS